MAITKCTGCGSVDWDTLLDGLCEVCNYEEFTRLQSENAYLKTLMQDIRNATDSQMQQSLLDLREENIKLKTTIELSSLDGPC